MDVDESWEVRADGGEVESMVGDKGVAKEERRRLCIATSTGADTVLANTRSKSFSAGNEDGATYPSTFAMLEKQQSKLEGVGTGENRMNAVVRNTG